MKRKIITSMLLLTLVLSFPLRESRGQFVTASTDMDDQSNVSRNLQEMQETMQDKMKLMKKMMWWAQNGQNIKNAMQLVMDLTCNFQDFNLLIQRTKNLGIYNCWFQTEVNLITVGLNTNIMRMMSVISDISGEQEITDRSEDLSEVVQEWGDIQNLITRASREFKKAIESQEELNGMQEEVKVRVNREYRTMMMLHGFPDDNLM